MNQSSGRRPRIQVRLNRNAPRPPLRPFTEYFQGFERVGAVRAVFGDRTDEVLGKLRVGFIPNRGMYMGIRDVDGNIAVGTYHLRTSPTRTLYLDIVHELFHVNQRMRDEKFFHDEFMKFMEDRTLYYASPIEIPAYAHTVREAERIGMTPAEITEYLKMGEAPPRVWRSFLKQMNLRTAKGEGAPAKRVERFPVKIKRETTAETYPFTDYFQGFEKAPAVRKLFGESTEGVLAGLRVEFIDSPFPGIYPDEGDGHLVVACDYFGKAPLRSVYLDAFLALNMLQALGKGGGEDRGGRGRKKEEEEEGGDAPSSSSSDGGDLFTSNPGVLRAYSEMVAEARALGTSDAEVLAHLVLPSFLMPPARYRKFLRSLGLKAG
ncbi:MAG: hypothetical protein ABSF83_15080 [Nitrososphaerales archaeon]